MPQYVRPNNFKTWQRLESRCRAADFEEGLEARTADPLWYLARQWQLGEFQAEDAGSLVNVEVQYWSEDIDGYALGAQDFTSLSETAPPLEVLVEREPILWDWRMRIRAGQHFERLLRECAAEKHVPSDHVEDFITYLRTEDKCRITRSDVDGSDNSTRHRVNMLVGKAVNGEILKDLLPGLTDPKGKVEQSVISKTRANFEAWLEELFCQPEGNKIGSPAWQTHSLDYKFAQKTAFDAGKEQQIELVSTHYRNGDLDWYSSNLKNEAEKFHSAVKSFSITPTRISFPGMPLPRWWAMEDYATDFGQMEVALPDLIKTLLAEFALIFGDDWFVIPLKLKTGTINSIKSITVTDVFGKTSTIETSGRVYDADPFKRWDLFSLANADNPIGNAQGDYLYIPPSTGFREESKPVEEVRFLRDEGANMVWGVEHTVANGWGKPVSAFDLYSEKYQEQQKVKREADQETPKYSKHRLVYQLASTIPSNWIPFVPTRITTTNDQVMLQMARVLREDDDSVEPKTRILNSWDEGEPETVNEEAISRAGFKVQLTSQRLRWIDGKTYVWQGRKVMTGRGEGRSGLVFDQVFQKKKD